MAIVVHKNEPFTMFPNYLIGAGGLSATTLAVALYLYSKPDGWRTHPADVRKRFDFGEHKWSAVSKELRKFGLLVEQRIQGGKVLTFNMIWKMDNPVDNECSTMPQIQNQGNSRVEEIPPYNNKDFLNKKDKINNKEFIKHPTIVDNFSYEEILQKLEKKLSHINIIPPDRWSSLTWEVKYFIDNRDRSRTALHVFNIAAKRIREGKWPIPSEGRNFSRLKSSLFWEKLHEASDKLRELPYNKHAKGH